MYPVRSPANASASKNCSFPNCHQIGVLGFSNAWAAKRPLNAVSRDSITMRELKRRSRRQQKKFTAQYVARFGARKYTKCVKAVRIGRFGGPDVLEVHELPVPGPSDDSVVVRVHAAGVGNWDVKTREGSMPWLERPPLTVGAEIAGTVIAMGPNANSFALGDEVYGATNARFTGGYAQYAVATPAMLAMKPLSLNFVQSSSVPIAACTAWQMLFDCARVGSGSLVLVHGAGGNVGRHAVQLANWAGARVIATARTHQIPSVWALQPDRVIDVRATPFEDVVPKVDVVIDTIGGDVQRRSMAVIAPGGILVSSVSAPDPVESANRNIAGEFVSVAVTTQTLTRLAALVHEGHLRTNVNLVLPLTHARRAHELLAAPLEHRSGKLVLEIIPN